MPRQSLKRVVNLARDLWKYPCFECNPNSRLCQYRCGNGKTAGVQFRGRYSSFGAATAALPTVQEQGFDKTEVVDFFVENLSTFNPGDYPVLLRLLQVLAPGDSVFDLGGGYGQCYYAYKNYIQFPQDVRWTVCDLPAFTSHGEEFARQKEQAALSFTNDRQEANGCSLYLSNGALQYIEADLAEILRELPSRPRHVLINRIPAYSGETYYTVQRGAATSYSPYKVVNAEQLIRSMEHLGYQKVDQWHLPRGLRVPFHEECNVPAYQGFYFSLHPAS